MRKRMMLQLQRLQNSIRALIDVVTPPYVV
jgi:hypothetical protein